MNTSHTCACMGPPGNCMCMQNKSPYFSFKNPMVNYWYPQVNHFNPPRRQDIPVIPPLPEGEPKPQENNPVVAICGECNLELRMVMWYACNNPRCPAFPKPTF